MMSSSNASHSQNHYSSQHKKTPSISSFVSTTSSSTIAATHSLDPISVSSIREENDKLNKRLNLLREEYVKLQAKHSDLQAKYDCLASTKQQQQQSSNLVGSASSSVAFVSSIVDFISSLFNNDSYSDLSAIFNDGTSLRLHKFVLKFRSANWAEFGDLTRVDTLELEDLNAKVGVSVFRWVYNGQIDLNGQSEDFIWDTARIAARFKLAPLIELCEDALIGFVRTENCIYFYQMSEEFKLSRLCEYSAKLVTLNWDSLQESDFQRVSTQFLHRLFKEKSRYPLHKAIRIHNEDLIFLLLVDSNSSQLRSRVNELDNLNELPLDLALSSDQFSIAKTLLENGANINAADGQDWPLLHRHISNNSLRAASFLIENGAAVNTTNPDGDTPLHLCADRLQVDVDADSGSILAIVETLLQSSANVNSQNLVGDSPVHRAVSARNVPVFDRLLREPRLSLDSNSHNNNHETVFLKTLDLVLEGNYYFAQQILAHHERVLEWSHPKSGDSLLHYCVRSSNEPAALFLIENGASPSTVNNRGESVLHLASYAGLRSLVGVLLQRNVNCNLLTLPPPLQSPSDELSDSESAIFNQTALHLAILGGHEEIIRDILGYHEQATRKGMLDSALLTPDLNVKNSKQQTPLSLAIEQHMGNVAQALINAGANVDVTDGEGLTMLHLAIKNRDSEMARFLLRNGADLSLTTTSGEGYLQFAVKHGLGMIIADLCKHGANVNIQCGAETPILWEALKGIKNEETAFEAEEMASILVANGADPDCWHQSLEFGFEQTLLHRALDENNEAVAVFLIRSACDMNSVRRPGPDGAGAEDCDQQTPLHMACAWGMANVVETLLEHSVEPNNSDSEGKTPLHIAILNQNPKIIEMLVGFGPTDLYVIDNYGNSPFSLAVKLKSRPTAQALCKRDPHVAEQTDGKGRNYLHVALEKNDYDSVLFLLDSRVNVSARVRDPVKRAPIHIAAESGTEIILRTLVLAGVNVNELTALNQTALHVAAEVNAHAIAEILLDMGVAPDVQDSSGNNALHIACHRGHYEVAKILLERRVFDVRCVNAKHHTVLHSLAVSQDKTNAVMIFDLMVENNRSQLEINARDAHGNTALLLAYMNGNGKLCRSIVREGAALGLRNADGVSIFNHEMPTKQLLTSLIDSLQKMPDWLDGPDCLECNARFGMTQRRHHCRHCGRELCSKCSSKEAVIIKFQQEKKSAAARVCDLCYDVLTIGVFN